MIKLTKAPILPNCQVPNGFFWYSCKFYHSKYGRPKVLKSVIYAPRSLPTVCIIRSLIIQKLKSKHLICLIFLWRQVFLREREKIFYKYSGPITSHSFVRRHFSPFCFTKNKKQNNFYYRFFS